VKITGCRATVNNKKSFSQQSPLNAKGAWEGWLKRYKSGDLPVLEGQCFREIKQMV